MRRAKSSSWILLEPRSAGVPIFGSSIKRREFVWNEVKSLIDFDKLEKSVKIVSLEDLIDIYPKMLKGETSGRYIVDLKK